MSKSRSTAPKVTRRTAAAGVPPVFASPAWWWVALLVVAVVVAYLPALGGGFIWDDDHYVTRNPTLRDLPGLAQIWFKVGAVPQYYPLVHSTFWLEYHLWGLHPLGYHLVNVLLHSLAAILLWRGLIKLQVPGAWLAAALFALHPVQVESVAWITERKNVLSAVFYFAAALAYLRFQENWESRKLRERLPSSPWIFYTLALALFLCALWSKTVTCSLPVALLLVRWWKVGRVSRRDVGLLLPFFIFGAGFGLLTAWMEKHTVGAVGAAWSLNIFERGLIAGRALWFYAVKLACPVNLTFIYPRWQINTAVWWQWLFPLTALTVVAGLWCGRQRLGRGVLVAVLFFAVTLFPALGFVDVYPFRYSFVADHFQYLAGVGLIVLAAVGLTRLPRFVSLALLVVVGVVTWRQAHVYRDLETLWRDTLKKNPASAIAHNNLGMLLAGRGLAAEAEAHYREALKVEPEDEETLSNLGVTLAGQGQVEQGLALLRRAMQINPDNAEICSNLGEVLVRRGEAAEAMALFEKAIRLRPTQAEFYYNLGSVLAGLGRTDEAIGQFRAALARRADYPDAHNNLALALAGQAKYDEAIQHYQEALRLDPRHALAQNNLGFVLVKLGHFDEATRCFAEAIRLNPDYANAHFNLGNALALQQKYEEAVRQFAATLRLAPTHVMAHKNMGMALARLGRREEAVAAWRAALQLSPDNPEVVELLRKSGSQ